MLLLWYPIVLIDVMANECLDVCEALIEYSASQVNMVGIAEYF